MDYSPIGNIPSGTLQMDCRDGMACPTTPAGGGRANHGENCVAPQTQTQEGQIGEREEDSFHGKLQGALLEHQGMPMVCDWHAPNR